MMTMSEPAWFKGIIRDLDRLGQMSDRREWQSQDVSSNPAMITIERTHQTIELNVPQTMESLQGAYNPSLPWAEDHFQERVSGIPHNPPPSEAWWPYAVKGNEAHKESRKFEIDSETWAYLAAMIDGDGSISYLKRYETDKGRPRIAITQKDHTFIDHLGQWFPMAKISARERDNVHTPDGTVRRSNAAQWYVGGKADTAFILEHIIPYLVLKKEIAQAALDQVRSLPKHHADKPGYQPDGPPLFSHTYPERFWPKRAGNSQHDRRGIRYSYGDLDDVVSQLVRNLFTRQAYLPVWMAEDTGAVEGQRVPCTLGYHFLVTDVTMDIIYFMRSCDAIRHLRDDAYMAARLLQWVVGKLEEHGIYCNAGKLVMHISSLHMFAGDEFMVDNWIKQWNEEEDDDYTAGVV